MQLHELRSAKPSKRAKARIGRGGKRGTYSGRGVKGQRSRAGHRIRPAYRDYIQRLPKQRGSKNPPNSRCITASVNLDQLIRINGFLVDRKTLAAAKLIPKRQARAKILGRGTATRKFIVRGVHVSQAAKAKIKAAGGQVEAIKPERVIK